ncbi:MAG: hypothetical protein P1U86_20665 [Verrucomicrobiales bacterium]|nr:hypothetical protein [Verrucomicrobiales bacterium]
MIQKPFKSINQRLSSRPLESNDENTVMPRMKTTKRMKKITIRAENHSMLVESHAHHLQIGLAFRTKQPKIKNVVSQPFEHESRRFREILVEKKPHATAS